MSELHPEEERRTDAIKAALEASVAPGADIDLTYEEAQELAERAADPSNPSDEEALRSQVSVQEMVEDHPDPAGEVKLWPLADPDERPEDVDGW